MGVAKMKLAAIQEITKLDDEHSLKELLKHLAKLSVTQEEKSYQLSQHFEAVVNKYENVLKKLAE